VTRRTVIVVELVLALNAVAGAVYAFGGATGVKREWLDGAPFHDHVILLIVVGGSLAAAAIAPLRRVPTEWKLSVAAGAVVVVAWIVVETLMIGLASWMQPATVAIALLITGLAIRLKPAGEGEV
jgi:hypothetical protein